MSNVHVLYRILRPPLVASFELPTRKTLLRLKEGDFAKLIFCVGNEPSERIWVILTDCTDTMAWKGKTDNDPVGLQTAKVLPAGSEVTFHPLDIIATE